MDFYLYQSHRLRDDSLSEVLYEVFIYVLLAQVSAFAICDNEYVDSITQKQLFAMAKRYNSQSVGMGVSITNGKQVTTSVAIFQGKGGTDGIKVDRIGSITVDLEKCEIHSTLIGLFEILEVK